MSEMNYFWFSMQQACCFNNIPPRLEVIINQLKPYSPFLESMINKCPNSIEIDGRRKAYTEATNHPEPSGNWDDYIFVGQDEGFPGLIVDDPLWELHIPKADAIN